MLGVVVLMLLWHAGLLLSLLLLLLLLLSLLLLLLLLLVLMLRLPLLLLWLSGLKSLRLRRWGLLLCWGSARQGGPCHSCVSGGGMFLYRCLPLPLMLMLVLMLPRRGGCAIVVLGWRRGMHRCLSLLSRDRCRIFWCGLTSSQLNCLCCLGCWLCHARDLQMEEYNHAELVLSWHRSMQSHVQCAQLQPLSS